MKRKRSYKLLKEIDTHFDSIRDFHADEPAEMK